MNSFTHNWISKSGEPIKFDNWVWTPPIKAKPGRNSNFKRQSFKNELGIAKRFIGRALWKYIANVAKDLTHNFNRITALKKMVVEDFDSEKQNGNGSSVVCHK